MLPASPTQLERLDADLKNYRHNSIKESIRRGYDALGDHHLDCGDLKSVWHYTCVGSGCVSIRVDYQGFPRSTVML